MNEYLEPDGKQDDKQSKKEKGICDDPLTNPGAGTDLKKKDSDKKKVLHEDGSLAELPDQNVEGGGALEGTVGLGN
ncbi:MAG: hypothetical protein JWP78_454 [Mucilaginibacter sp.]|nr:hypothetical protein [Mucilaginibacter sp.]